MKQYDKPTAVYEMTSQIRETYKLVNTSARDEIVKEQAHAADKTT